MKSPLGKGTSLLSIVTSILEDVLFIPNVGSPQNYLDAFYKFIVLASKNYDYFCGICSFYPAVLMMDVQRKLAFRFDREVKSSGNNINEGKVNVTEF